MQKILILGHKGMLGRAVHKYMCESTVHEVYTIEDRWPSQYFKENIIESPANFVINCIGKIPQKSGLDDQYDHVNKELPIFLESIGKKIIHPSTDCEFSGNISIGKQYSKYAPRDAEDAYGSSKAFISKLIESEFTNTKIIRTSIVGHEESSHLSLLDWFLSNSDGDQVNGFTNHYWNGITTLEWAKQCCTLIENWDNAPMITQLGTQGCISKYDLLCICNSIYERSIVVEPHDANQEVNKCLKSDLVLPSIKQQLQDLKFFFRNNSTGSK